jgi:protein TonB
VLIKWVIDENGIPTDPIVERSLEKGLDEKAVEAVKKWRFKPGLKGANLGNQAP